LLKLSLTTGDFGVGERHIRSRKFIVCGFWTEAEVDEGIDQGQWSSKRSEVRIFCENQRASGSEREKGWERVEVIDSGVRDKAAARVKLDVLSAS